MFLHRGKPQNLPAKYFCFHSNYIAIDGTRIDGEKTKGQTWKNHNVTDDIQVCIKHEECTNENGMLHLD